MRFEAAIRGQSAEQRQFVRQQRSRPLIDAMHGWLHQQLERVSGRSALAKAIRYALNHWNRLTDVLQRIVSARTKSNELHTLLPWNSKLENRAHVFSSA